MKRILYKLLIPNSIKSQLYSFYYKQFKEEELIRLKQEREAVRRIELSQVYISNLKVLIDRTELLNKLPKYSCVGEICVRDGNLPLEILLVTKPRKLHLIDIVTTAQGFENSVDIIKNQLIGEVKSGQVIVDQGNYLEQLDKFDDHYFDWLYLDALSTYWDVTRALEVCKAKVKKQGIIAGSNYISGSLFEKKWYGVIEAVNEFCKKNYWEIIYLTHESHCFLSYALSEMKINHDPN
jgi:hypothetical protein